MSEKNNIKLVMGRITRETFKQTIRYNREILYHIPAAYEHLKRYVGTGKPLRDTLLAVLRYIESLNVMIIGHRYIFFVSNKTWTHKVRKKGAASTASVHINLLCAIGLLTKIPQRKDVEGGMIKPNIEFMSHMNEKKEARNIRPVNVYSIRKYTKKELERLDSRAKLLLDHKVTTGNFAYNMLALNELIELGNEVFPNNERDAPLKKLREAQEFAEVLQFIVENQGYATKKQIRDNLLIDEREIDKLFKYFKPQIEEYYSYRRPTKKQKDQWGLRSYKWVYMKKEEG